MCLWSLLISGGFLPLPDYTDYNPLPTVSPLLVIGGGSDKLYCFRAVYIVYIVYTNYKPQMKAYD